MKAVSYAEVSTLSAIQSLSSAHASGPPFLDFRVSRRQGRPGWGGVRAAMTPFKASKTVSIPCQEARYPVEQYLADVERVVHVTFPDSSRLTDLGNNRWRARLRPVSFFAISATPVCELKAWYEERSLRIFSDKVWLDVVGLPEQFRNVKLYMTLAGKLYPVRSPPPPGAAAAHAPPSCTLDGWVTLNLEFAVPPPFSLLPEAAVCSVGNAILDGILSAMQGALLGGLVRDFRAWSSDRWQQDGDVAGKAQGTAALAGAPVARPVRK